MKIEAYGRTDCGPVRDNNEDSLLLDEELGIFIIADGMGGHAAGEVASEMAVESIHEVLMGQSDPDETRLVRDYNPEDTSDIMRERLAYATNQASIKIRRAAMESADKRGMGTTVVVLVVDGQRAHLAHVGDSRAYLLRDGIITRLTRDHTVVQQEIDAGRITPALAKRLPNMLTQSVGYQGRVEPDTSTRIMEPGDRFMLCTDGLTDVLSDERIGELMGSAPLDEVADVLVEAALSEGTRDNVTVAVVGYRS